MNPIPTPKELRYWLLFIFILGGGIATGANLLIPAQEMSNVLSTVAIFCYTMVTVIAVTGRRKEK